jgi:hypothetical protein
MALATDCGFSRGPRMLSLVVSSAERAEVAVVVLAALMRRLASE